MSKFKFRIGLLPRIIIAIALGIALGSVLPASVLRGFLTFNGLFSEFLGFAIPLIILGLVTVAIADIGKGAGKMLLAAVSLAYFATIVSGFLAYGSASYFFPKLISPSMSTNVLQTGESLQPFFGISIPPLMSVMTALVLSFVLGLGLSVFDNSALKSAMKDFQEIVTALIAKVIIPLLPLYIFGIFVGMTAEGKVMSILSVFIKIIGFIFAIHVLLLLFQFAIAGIVARKNPLKLLWNMLPAYFTALGTQSSAATIPVTLRSTLKNGVSPSIAGFTIPLFATIHLSGSTLKIVSCALALMILHGMPHSFGLFAGFVCMLGITMVAAPGVPGGAIMAALGVLQSMLGFDESLQALMIALYIAMDNFGTACNVTGDGALSLIIDRAMRPKES